jgi:hypothetical protein
MDAPLPPSASSSPPPLALDRDQPCLKCGYQLRGLPLAGVCPECGTPIEDSLKGYFLQYASPEYRKKVGMGLSLILAAILLMIVLSFVGIGAEFAMGRSQGLDIVFAILSLVVTAVNIVGYWNYTEPDPDYTGVEKPNSARQVARLAVVAQAVIHGVQLVAAFFQSATDAVPGASPGVSTTEVLGVLVGLLGLAAWATQFFAIMHYTRWMGSRIPDAFIQRRAKTYMWLLPVLCTAGALVLVGPLIALVLYWTLLERLRKHVKSISATRSPAKLTDVSA